MRTSAPLAFASSRLISEPGTRDHIAIRTKNHTMFHCKVNGFIDQAYRRYTHRASRAHVSFVYSAATY